MNLIETLIGKLQAHPKRFVFTDGADPRLLQAAGNRDTQNGSAHLGDRSLVGIPLTSWDNCRNGSSNQPEAAISISLPKISSRFRNSNRFGQRTALQSHGIADLRHADAEPQSS